MTDKLELKSNHEVIETVNVADVESIFYCKPTDPDILTVLMTDGKRLYCDEVCPVDSMQEEPVSEDLEKAVWHDASEFPEEHKHIFAKGRESMREQIMKNAVDGILVDNIDGSTSICFNEERYGERVKVIIIREGKV